MMTEAILFNVLLHLFTLHECKVIVYLPNINNTNVDYEFITEISPLLNISLLVQNVDIDMSHELNMIGKACIMSFSESALSEFAFNNRQKRPAKILIGKIYSFKHTKPDYKPIIIEYPPVISVKEATFSSGDLYNLLNDLSNFTVYRKSNNNELLP